MATFKTTCKIQNEEKGIHEVEIFIRDVEDEDEAESTAKYHFCTTPNSFLWCIKM